MSWHCIIINSTPFYSQRTQVWAINYMVALGPRYTTTSGIRLLNKLNIWLPCSQRSLIWQHVSSFPLYVRDSLPFSSSIFLLFPSLSPVPIYVSVPKCSRPVFGGRGCPHLWVLVISLVFLKYINPNVTDEGNSVKWWSKISHKKAENPVLKIAQKNCKQSCVCLESLKLMTNMFMNKNLCSSTYELFSFLITGLS